MRHGVFVGCAAAALAALMALPACAEHDLSLKDFPRQPGETTDEPRIRRAVACAQTGEIVYFPRGLYRIGSQLTVTNAVSLELHPAARLQAVAPMDFVLRYDAEPPCGNLTGRIFNYFVRGGEIDGNGLAGCFNVNSSWHFNVSDMTMRNAKTVGFQIGRPDDRRGGGINARNLFLFCDKAGMQGNVGVWCFGGDMTITDVCVIDHTVGVRDSKCGNRWTRIHVWGGLVRDPVTKKAVMLENSVGFDLDGTGDALLDNCYADTALVGFRVNGAGTRLHKCTYLNNPVFKLDHVAAVEHLSGSLRVDGFMYAPACSNAVPYRRLGKAERWMVHWSNDHVDWGNPQYGCDELNAVLREQASRAPTKP